jgi:predicted lipoprotein with Yx(FWY)xxD motif
LSRIRFSIAALALVAVAAFAGCGSSSNGGGAYGGGESAAASKPASAQTSQPVASVSTEDLGGDLGSVLVDSEGFTLYYFEKDKGGKSACYGNCAQIWPPLTTEGPAEAKGGAVAAKLGTTERSDGTVQVTYAGWPLYTYVDDKKAGENNGTDSKAFGASWYPLHPNGQKAGD